MTSEKQRIANLAFFLNPHREDGLRVLRKQPRSRRTDNLYDSLGTLETVLWTLIGTDIGQFDKASAQAVFANNSKLILMAHKAVSNAGMLSRFPKEFEGVFATIGRPSDLKWSLDLLWENARSDSFFLTSGLLNWNFRRSATTTRLSGDISVANSLEWEVLEPQLTGVRKFETRLPTEVENYRAIALDGFLKVVEFMESHHRLVQPTPTDENTGFRKLAELLNGIQKWRMNFSDDEARGRFAKVTAFVVDEIARQYEDSSEVRPSLIRSFTARTQLLMANWGGAEAPQVSTVGA